MRVGDVKGIMMSRIGSETRSRLAHRCQSAHGGWKQKVYKKGVPGSQTSEFLQVSAYSAVFTIDNANRV